VRRDSTESIGNAADLLHPSTAAAKDNEGLDEPDFWDKMSQFSVRMRKDGRFFFQVIICFSILIMTLERFEATLFDRKTRYLIQSIIIILLDRHV